MPRDPLAVERASPADLLIVAQTRLRERQKLPTYTLHLAWLHFLMLLKKMTGGQRHQTISLVYTFE